MSNGRVAAWVVLALLGIVLAAALTWSVVRLSGEHIGLASAPISEVRGLAPGPTANAVTAPEHEVTRTVTQTITVSRTVTEAAATSPPVAGTTPPASVTKPPVTTTGPPTAATTTATSAVTVTSPSSGGAPSRSDDGRDGSRSTSGSGRDD